MEKGKDTILEKGKKRAAVENAAQVIFVTIINVLLKG